MLEVWQSLLTLIVLKSQVANTNKWIGPTEKLRCQCSSDGCVLTGTSYSCDNSCKTNQLGYACQYVDVVSKVSQTYPRLTDDNSNTCLESDIDEVKINIYPSMIRFVQVTFAKIADVKNTMFTFETVKGRKHCLGSYFVSGSRYMKYECVLIFKATHVIISGSAVKNICDVFVVKGRNVATRASVGQTGSNFTLSRDWAMTDGDLSREDQLCTKVSLSKTNPIVFITFDFPVVVYSIDLTMGSGTNGSMMKYQISTGYTNGETIWTEETPAFFGSSKTFFHDEVAGVVAKISIRFIGSLKTTSEFYICELEAFGDCAHNYHGLECEHICSQLCKDRVCNVEGLCFQCRSADMTGPMCCSINCGGDQNCHPNGTCTMGCVVGYYGSECKNVCSVNCGGNRQCEMNSGHCTTGCRAGYYGSSCSDSCSNNCGGNGSCDVNSGHCTACRTGYWGPTCSKICNGTCGGNGSCDIKSGHCNEGCKPSYWGSACIQKCSLFCDNDGSCDRNGSCIHGCKTGYYGEECNKRGMPYVDGKWTCHCAEGNCSDETNMCPTDQCIKGWFAQSCEYRDAGVFAKMSHPALNDNNDSTCYESTNNTVTASWDKDFEVSWVRLVFHSEATVNRFEILYDLQQKRKLCTSPNALHVPFMHNVFDLDCFVFTYARKVSVTWYGQGSLCTFNICNGRNMAEFAVPFVQGQKLNMSLPSLTDGDISNCSTFDKDRDGILSLDFRRPVSISLITFYITPSVNDVVIEVLFLRSYIGVESKMTFTLVSNTTEHAIRLDAVALVMLQIRFLVGQSSICEIELDGECHQNTYGLKCQEFCRFTCFRNRCTYDGRCFDCVLGKTGTHCENDYTEPVSDDVESTNETSRFEISKDLDTVTKTMTETYVYVISLAAWAVFLTIIFCKRSSKFDDNVFESEMFTE